MHMERPGQKTKNILVWHNDIWKHRSSRLHSSFTPLYLKKHAKNITHIYLQRIVVYTDNLCFSKIKFGTPFYRESKLRARSLHRIFLYKQEEVYSKCAHTSRGQKLQYHDLLCIVVTLIDAHNKCQTTLFGSRIHLTLFVEPHRPSKSWQGDKRELRQVFECF